jgi:hypothetical protein
LENLAGWLDDAGEETMISSVITYEHGLAAKNYIREELSRFGGLRRFLSERDVDSARVFSFLPFLPDKPYLERFDCSIFDSFGGWEAVNHEFAATELEFITRYLQSDPRHLAMFQADYFRVSSHDRAIRLAPGERAFLHRRKEGPPVDIPLEMWVYVEPEEASKDTVGTAMMRGSWHRGIGALTSLPPTVETITPLEELPETVVRDLANNAAYITVNAYDAEILLFCELR